MMRIGLRRWAYALLVPAMGLGAGQASAQIQRSFINPGFEEPAQTCASGAPILSSSDVPGWSSTHPNAPGWLCTDTSSSFTAINPIEIWKGVRPGGVQRPGSQQLAELNASQASRLYQELCLIRGETITYSFWHQQRDQGSPLVPDVMAYGLNFVGDTSTPIAMTMNGAAVSATNPAATSSVLLADGWKQTSGTVVFNGTTNVYQVGFASVSTSSGDLTTGNLIDDVQFTVNPVVEFWPGQNVVVREGGTATVNLRVSGLLTAPKTVRLQITGGTATVGSDYQLPNGTAADFTVTVPAGNYDGTQVVPVNFPALSDALLESDENFTVAIKADAAYVISSATTCNGLPVTSVVVTIQDASATNMQAVVTLPSGVGAGGTGYGTLTCTNVGANPASNATCTPTQATDNLGNALAITVTSCSPVPPTTLAVNAAITCQFTYPVPGPAGGGDTVQTTVTVTGTTSATNDIISGDNTSILSTSIVDAVSLSASPAAGSSTATTSLGASSQYPANSIFSVVVGAGTTCTPVSVNASTGAATYGLPSAGGCTIQFQICAPNTNPAQCDTATLTAPVVPADLTAAISVANLVVAPGSTATGTVTCQNIGTVSSSVGATCTPTAVDNQGNAVPVTLGTCTPAAPATVAPGASMSCPFSYVVPGTPGGTDTTPTSVTVTATAGSSNDADGTNNTGTITPTIVDAVDQTANPAPGSAGTTTPLGIRSQYPTGSVFTLVTGPGTTCANASVVNGSATYDVPASGICTVQFQICAPAPNQTQCDTATLSAPVAPANVTAAIGVTNSVVAPGSTTTGTITCTSNGTSAALGTTCTPTAVDSLGQPVPVTLGSCRLMPAGTAVTPPVTVPTGSRLECGFSYVVPGTAGGVNTPATGVTLTGTASASNDGNPADNMATTSASIIDAIDLGVPASPGPATTRLDASEPAPAGSTFTVVPAGTTCANASITGNSATYTVPGAGTCTVQFQICAPSPNQTQCDTATLTAPVNPANMSVSVTNTPTALAPGGTGTGTVTCTNSPAGAAYAATCFPSAVDSQGIPVAVTVSSCTLNPGGAPVTPPTTVPASGSIVCNFSYVVPGTPGGTDTGPASVTVTGTTGASNDSNSGDNILTTATAIVDAVNKTLTQTAGSPATTNLGTLTGVTFPPNSVFGPDPNNAGTCGNISIDAATGVATYNVPMSGSCTVGYQICAPAPNQTQCDVATLTVRAQELTSVPTLGEWARGGLMLLLGVFGVLALRRQRQA